MCHPNWSKDPSTHNSTMAWESHFRQNIDIAPLSLCTLQLWSNLRLRTTLHLKKHFPLFNFKPSIPGESIAITADFENLSSRTIIPHATLHQTQTFVAGGKSRTRHSKYTIVTGLAIQPGRNTSWDAQMLKIPAVTPSIINCCLIRVDYAVRVSLGWWSHYQLLLYLHGLRCQDEFGLVIGGPCPPSSTAASLGWTTWSGWVGFWYWWSSIHYQLLK